MNFNHFNFQNISFIVLCKFCARPAQYSKSEARGQRFDWFLFLAFIYHARIKQKPFVMAESCLFEFLRNTEKPEELLYLNQASRIITPGCFCSLFLCVVMNIYKFSTCSKFLNSKCVNACPVLDFQGSYPKLMCLHVWN